MAVRAAGRVYCPSGPRTAIWARSSSWVCGYAAKRRTSDSDVASVHNERAGSSGGSPRPYEFLTATKRDPQTPRTAARAVQWGVWGSLWPGGGGPLDSDGEGSFRMDGGVYVLSVPSVVRRFRCRRSPTATTLRTTPLHEREAHLQSATTSHSPASATIGKRVKGFLVSYLHHSSTITIALCAPHASSPLPPRHRAQDDYAEFTSA
ncbi:hypothetical protein B0H14DRAFT_3899347 [Mycena olivaceomarginata]|nr:hypothetical protein B0H14DRAFT_3899347 [Mycena olivaceomarginata]